MYSARGSSHPEVKEDRGKGRELSAVTGEVKSGEGGNCCKTRRRGENMYFEVVSQEGDCGQMAKQGMGKLEQDQCPILFVSESSPQRPETREEKHWQGSRTNKAEHP